jgi:hypothetical protein
MTLWERRAMSGRELATVDQFVHRAWPISRNTTIPKLKNAGNGVGRFGEVPRFENCIGMNQLGENLSAIFALATPDARGHQGLSILAHQSGALPCRDFSLRKLGVRHAAERWTRPAELRSIIRFRIDPDRCHTDRTVNVKHPRIAQRLPTEHIQTDRRSSGWAKAEAAVRICLSVCLSVDWALLGLVLLSIGLGLVPVLFEPSLNWWDEIFQATEQAHRVIYGTGLEPWEFQLGVRSWLLPGVIVILMEFARIAGEGPDIYLPVIAVAFAALGAAPVVCCVLWCRKFYGRWPALAGGVAVAAMPELVYFGARALTEVVAGHILVVALYVLQPRGPAVSRRRAFIGGLLLALVFLLRVQLAPAVALVMAWAGISAPRERQAAMAAGALAAVTFSGVLDALLQVTHSAGSGDMYSITAILASARRLASRAGISMGSVSWASGAEGRSR